MKLSKDKRYSPKDSELFRLIPKGDSKRIDSTTLVDRYYEGKIPFNGRQCVMAGVRTLGAKIRYYREPFRLVISPRRGPWPVEIWIESSRSRKGAA